MHKYANNNLPACFHDFFALTSQIHHYDTRASHTSFYLARTNKSLTKRSIKITGVKVWNNLPTELHNFVHYSAFVFLIK